MKTKKIIPFFKMVASGNDFVVIDNRKRIVPALGPFTRKVCTPHTGVGADGVLLMEHARRGDFKMRILNADGSEAEACGNGFRCIALLAHRKLGFPSRFRFASMAGLVEAEIQGQRVRVGLPAPKELRLRGAIEVNENRLHYSFINTGVPHLIIFVHGIDKIDVENLGRALRHHKQFQPRGTNVNFVEIQNSQRIRVRTYERGVEQETLACGTGSTASAIVSALMGYVKPPVTVKTRGGEELVIDFKRKGNRVSKVSLEGRARLVYEGQLQPV